MTRTFLITHVYINGTDAVNAGHLRRSDGRPLATALFLEIKTPPLFCAGMFVCPNVVSSEHLEIKELVWIPERDAIIMTCHHEIIYRDQGPKHLAGRERAEAFFDQFLDSMIASGWERDGKIKSFLYGDEK